MMIIVKLNNNSITVERKEIEQVRKFKFLSEIIDNLEYELNEKIEKIGKLFSSMKTQT